MAKIKPTKILVICDIQSEFISCISADYLRKVRSFITRRKWDKIIVVVDTVNSDSPLIPEWIYNKATEIVHKSYCSFDMCQIEDGIEEGEFEEISNFRAWKSKWNHLIVETTGCHETFKIPEKMQRIIKEIKEIPNRDVTMIGGAYDECLQDVYDAFRYFEVESTIHNDYTYGGTFRQPLEWHDFDFAWVELPESDYL